MSEGSSNEKVVYWPRVKELLDGIMHKWEERWGRDPLPGIHAYYWETPEELQEAVLSGIRAIEPGVPGGKRNWCGRWPAAWGPPGGCRCAGPFMPRTRLRRSSPG